jgi:hypothetical protein
MSVAREMSEVETTPAVAFKKPVSVPRVKEPAVRLVVDAYVDERSVDDAFWNDCSAVKVFAVYVFGIVVEALIYASTDELKLETCDEVMARFGSAVMLATEVVPARLPMNDVVARAVVK